MSVFNRLLFTLSLLLATLSLSQPVYAGLILNGSFESNDVATGKWKWYTADKVSGWQGSNIEIWDNLFGFASFDGNQHIELNSHGSKSADAFSIYQTFDTQIGQTYSLSFAYSARRNSQEAFSVAVTDAFQRKLLNDVIDDHTRRVWSTYDSTFIATSDSTTLRFTSITPSNRTVGNLIDAVEVNEVPEPSPVMLLLFALLMFVVKSRRTI